MSLELDWSSLLSTSMSPWFDYRPRTRIPLGSTRSLNIWALTRYAAPSGLPLSALVHWSVSPFFSSFWVLPPSAFSRLGVSYAFISGYASFLGCFAGISFAFSSNLFLESFFGVGSRTLFSFISVPGSFFWFGPGPSYSGCFGLGPYPWLLDLTTMCGGIYSLIFSVSNSRIFDLPLLVFWDELRYHPSTAAWSAYPTIQGGLMWWSVRLGYRIKIDSH